MLNVKQIKLKLDFGVFDGRSVLILDLGPSGYSWTYRVPLVIKRDLLPQHSNEFRTLGPGSHKAHVAPQHVHKLGNLIQAIFPQELANPSDSRVVSSSPFGSVIFSVVPHRPELQDLERPTVKSPAILPKPNRPA